MEILLKGIDSSQNKLLANALGQHGHAVSHCTDIVNAHKILDRKIWELEIVICQIDTAKPTEALKFAEYITEAKIQRGYYDKPFIILLISGRIDEPLRRAVGSSGAFLCIIAEGDYSSLISHINFIRDQELMLSSCPCIVIQHSVPVHPGLYCTDEEHLIGISISCRLRNEPTDQTPLTAVLIDYLSQQRYPKTDEAISAGIAASRFYMAQLKGEAPPPTSLKRLVQRSRDTLDPVLKFLQSGTSGKMLIRNIPGHTHMYKFEGLVKVVHTPQF